MRCENTIVDINHIINQAFINWSLTDQTTNHLAWWRSGYRARLEILFLRERRFESCPRRSFCSGCCSGDIWLCSGLLLVERELVPVDMSLTGYLPFKNSLLLHKQV
jgi:hypothetical protein